MLFYTVCFLFTGWVLLEGESSFNKGICAPQRGKERELGKGLEEAGLQDPYSTVKWIGFTTKLESTISAIPISMPNVTWIRFTTKFYIRRSPWRRRRLLYCPYTSNFPTDPPHRISLRSHLKFVWNGVAWSEAVSLVFCAFAPFGFLSFWFYFLWVFNRYVNWVCEIILGLWFLQEEAWWEVAASATCEFDWVLS